MSLMAKKIFLTEILSNIILLHKIIFSSDAYIYSLRIFFHEPANFEEPPMLQNNAWVPCRLNGFKRHHENKSV